MKGRNSRNLCLVSTGPRLGFADAHEDALVSLCRRGWKRRRRSRQQRRQPGTRTSSMFRRGHQDDGDGGGEMQESYVGEGG